MKYSMFIFYQWQQKSRKRNRNLPTIFYSVDSVSNEMT